MEAVSNVKEISFSQQKVYETLAYPEKLNALKSALPQDKADSITFSSDSITIQAPMVGSVTLNIVEREEPKTIKFGADVATSKGNMWIQLLPTSDASCKMKLTIKADIPFFLKNMVEKPLKEGIEKIADMLAALPYGNI